MFTILKKWVRFVDRSATLRTRACSLSLAEARRADRYRSAVRNIRFDCRSDIRGCKRGTRGGRGGSGVKFDVHVSIRYGLVRRCRLEGWRGIATPPPMLLGFGFAVFRARFRKLEAQRIVRSVGKGGNPVAVRGVDTRPRHPCDETRRSEHSNNSVIETARSERLFRVCFANCSKATECAGRKLGRSAGVVRQFDRRFAVGVEVAGKAGIVSFPHPRVPMSVNRCRLFGGLFRSFGCSFGRCRFGGSGFGCGFSGFGLSLHNVCSVKLVVPLLA